MKVRNSQFDIVANIICIVMLIAMGAYLLVAWKSMPEKVPMHYNFAGEIDRWGSKSEALLLPILALVLYIFMTVTERFPKLWNTGVKITENNRAQVYRTVKSMVSTIKVILVGVFAYLTIMTVKAVALPLWFLPIFLVILFVPMGFWLWKLYRLR